MRAAVEPSLPRRAASAGWLLLGLVAFTELLTHATVRSRVPSEEDWKRAAAFVRSSWRAGDLAVAAPRWADPLLRMHLRGLVSLRGAARSDLAGYSRLWSISQRGHRPEDAPHGPPELRRRFGRLMVERWRLRSPRLLYDFTARAPQTVVAVRSGEGPWRPCPWRRLPVTTPGGLDRGPMPPARRALCPGGGWVGGTVLEDLSLRLRRCLRVPAGRRAVRVRHEGVTVPEGARLIVHAGLPHREEREGRGPALRLRVLQDGEEIGRMVHRDGEGWKSLEAWPEHREGAGSVFTFLLEGVAGARADRSFCWDASLQSKRPEEAP